MWAFARYTLGKKTDDVIPKCGDLPSPNGRVYQSLANNIDLNIPSPLTGELFQFQVNHVFSSDGSSYKCYWNAPQYVSGMDPNTGLPITTLNTAGAIIDMQPEAQTLKKLSMVTDAPPTLTRICQGSTTQLPIHPKFRLT